MLVYLCVLCTYLVFGGLIKVTKFGYLDKEILMSFLGVIIFSPLMAFRSYNVGTDTYNYAYNIFLSSNTDGVFDSRFPVYMLFNKMVYFVNDHWASILVFNAFVTLACMSFFYYMISKNIYMSWAYYFIFTYYILSFNAMRQFLAISLTLVAYALFTKGWKINSLLLYILAIFTHLPVIVGILVPFFTLVNWNMKKIVCIGVITIVISEFLEEILVKFSFLFGTYEAYLVREGVWNLFDNDGSGNRCYVGVLILFASGCVLYFLNRYNLNENTIWTYTSLMIIVSLITMIFSKASMVIRLIYPLTIFSTVWIPEIVETIPMTKMSRVILYTMIGLIMLLPCYLRLQHFIPYTFFWEI